MTEPPRPPQRIGFAERDAAVEALQRHHAEGRLTAEEFEERMEAALQAKTRDDLAPLFADLPRAGDEAVDQPAALVAPATDTTRQQLEHHHGGSGLDLPADEPISINVLRIIGWLAVPAGFILAFTLGMWWAIFPGFLVSGLLNGIAETAKRRHQAAERLRLEQQQQQRKELW
ncbi:DUF1707 SHOCT-like domain-containing protein [Propionibacteriaceae bacterium G1746]|uniref:DUF1707 SHOCT-like domain-containing protein n=1 Tax=Aestuariimicrobium sp. G57 TaxID=3418485 RepID=UPI003C1F061E